MPLTLHPDDTKAVRTLRPEQFPAMLRGTAAAPTTLRVMGHDLDGFAENAVAIVGSRTASKAALDATTEIAAALARRGTTVVSGLARGVDTAAHRAAIAASGKTIAVLGTGLSNYFPPENRRLQDLIARNGVVVSQFADTQGGTKTTFPARNAVIAGLSKVSIVVSAAERSGTRIQMDWATRLRRPVLLWEPSFSDALWASRYVDSEPCAHFVTDVDMLLQHL